MAILPVLIACGVCAGIVSDCENARNIFAALAMIGLASIQLFVGMIVLGPNGLLNGYELKKKQPQG